MQNSNELMEDVVPGKLSESVDTAQVAEAACKLENLGLRFSMELEVGGKLDHYARRVGPLIQS